ncbi:hypothetical protein [Sphingomonas soli]|uniref:hypothetical protein n=1 Tax=Sphingomonas soli TaxID=266127 RepID=UPI00082C6899|nr:hypothetical protein [Sphingomonas soli]
MIAAFLASAALALSSAPAEDWRAVEGVGDAGAQFWIDMDSIRLEGAITHFRIRFSMPNVEGLLYVDSAADCAGKTVEIRHVRRIKDGQTVASEDIPPGTQPQSLEDEQGLILQKLICKS